MNVNDIYSCIPLDTPIETIVYQVESMTPDEVDKNNAILQRVINKVLNSWLKNRFKKFQCYCFALNEFEPKHLSDNSTEIRLSIMPGYDNSCQANVSQISKLSGPFAFLQMHTPYGVDLDAQAAHLVGKIVMLKLLFGVESVGHDYSDVRLITDFIGSTISNAIQKAMPAQSLEEILLNLSLEGAEV